MDVISSEMKAHFSRTERSSNKNSLLVCKIMLLGLENRSDTRIVYPLEFNERLITCDDDTGTVAGCHRPILSRHRIDGKSTGPKHN